MDNSQLTQSQDREEDSEELPLLNQDHSEPLLNSSNPFSQEGSEETTFAQSQQYASQTPRRNQGALQPLTNNH